MSRMTGMGRRVRRAALLGGALLLASVTLAACGSSSSSGASAGAGASSNAQTNKPGGKTIEFIPTSAIPYFNSEYTGIKAEAKKDGYNTVEQAPSSDADFADQVQMVKEAVSNHVAAIVLVPFSPTALVDSVKEAEAAHIPVIATDSTLSPMVAKSFIAVDDSAAAEAVARYAAKAVHGHGEYDIVDYNLSTSSGIARRNGFEKAMKAFPGMKYAGIQISNEVVQTALSETTTQLERNPKINVIFAADDSSAVGVAQAVDRLHDQKKVVVVGFDADLGEVNYIKSGTIEASALQAPVRMGQAAVQSLHKIFGGGSVPKTQTLAYHLVTTKNLGAASSVAAVKQYVPGYGK